ncbi:AlbA family DNA-binding domain-containing protein [Rhodococcus qingshengii]|uniref:AlbA family DNA-binding domain-containing protein n=1 Tax=Rhodococcus qingshengii TaxID=334542 RepID=UPI0010A68568|nr:ATP-binding protein [Rhodococcus qingshengii]THJ73971.1 ATP-binding protein [Rhodococcus qingshengii]
MEFPRLTAAFGEPVSTLSASAIDAAVEQKMPEDSDLDWKQAHYSNEEKGKNELAKDVAAMANGVGGLIVIGIAEQDGRAAASSTVALGDGEASRMRQVLAGRIRPFLVGVAIRPVHLAEDSGYYVISVPRSADAPHAVVKNDLLGFPVRNGTTTRWLSEAEVGVAYRDRFSGRVAIEESLNRVCREGMTKLHRTKGPWICVATTPSIAGTRESSSVSVARTVGFLQTWARYAAPTSLIKYVAQSATSLSGVRRTIFSGNIDYEGVSTRVHAELHHSGAGFAAIQVGGRSQNNQDSSLTQCDQIPQDLIEDQLHSLVSLLANHAADTGGGGELEISAKLLLAQMTDSDLTLRQAEIQSLVGAAWTHTDELDRAPGSIALGETTQSRMTTSTNDILMNPRGPLSAAYGLATDLLGEFGIAEPCAVQRDGSLRLEMMTSSRRSKLNEWAYSNKLLDQA